MQEISNYIGIILGFLSIAATAFFAHRYSEKKSPQYMYETTKKIQRSKDAPDDIEVLYKGEKVESINSTLLWFWNSGRKPITKEDIPESQTIKIKLKSDGDIEILDVSLLKTSREVIEATVQKCSPDTFELKFNFLDHKDGIALEILHTGTIETTVEISGTILGSPSGIKCVIGKNSSSRSMIDVLSRGSARKKESSLKAKLLSTLLLTVIFGGGVYFIFSLPTEITTTKSLLTETLSNFVTSGHLEEAVGQVIENSKYKFLQYAGPYFIGGIILLNLIVGYRATWGRRYPYPRSIAYIASTGNSRSGDNKIEQENSSDA
jgi:hypothetical protein